MKKNLRSLTSMTELQNVRQSTLFTLHIMDGFPIAVTSRNGPGKTNTLLVQPPTFIYLNQDVNEFPPSRHTKYEVYIYIYFVYVLRPADSLAHL